ncbi:MAG: zinc ribbon domain-containing protein, partial [Clostridia bacterium]|nr:zinc ribbon domain-containing protein [Clostridia bacterium]
TPRKLHFAILFAIIPLVFLSNASNSFSVLGIALFVFNGILALVGFWGLIRFRVYGAIFTLLFFWTSALSFDAQNVILAIIERSKLTSLSVVGQLVGYVFSDIAIQRAIFTGIILLIVSIIFTAYYVKRRYLFHKICNDKFDGHPLCPDCGKPSIKNEAFCTSCGFNLEDGEGLDLDVNVLDKVKHCPQCGSYLNNIQYCPNCASAKHIKGNANNATDVIKCVTAFVVIALMIIPAAVGGRIITTLVHDRTPVNNAYVAKFDEFLSDPQIANDSDWLKEYTVASNALYAVNNRIFHVNINMLRKGDVLFYGLYSEAAFKQMRILEEVDEAVHNVDHSNIASLAQRINETLDEMLKAVEKTYRYYQNDASLFLDGFRVYTGHFNLNFMMIAIVLLALGISTLWLSLEKINIPKISWVEKRIEISNLKTQRILSSKSAPAPEFGLYQPAQNNQRVFLRLKAAFLGGIGFYVHCFVRALLSFLLLILCAIWLLISVFRLRNIVGAVQWVKKSLIRCPAVKVKKAAKKEKRFIALKYKLFKYIACIKEKVEVNFKSRIIKISLFIVVLVVIGLLIGSPPNKTDYLDAAYNVIHGSSMEISFWMAEVNRDPQNAFSEEKVAAVFQYIETQIENIDIIVNYGDIPSDYESFHSNLLQFCKEEEQYLVELKNRLADGYVPSQALMSNYANLRANRLLHEYIEIQLQNAIQGI